MPTIKDIHDEEPSEETNPQKKPKATSSWFNWTIPLLLISIGFCFLVFYPSPEKNQYTSNKKTATKITKASELNSNTTPQNLANKLVQRFFNGTEEDRTAQLSALEKTLIFLQSQNTNTLANKAYNDLKNNNLNSAIKLLISLSSQQETLQSSATMWINIGNIQNLSSSPQALQAYKKASEIDPENMNAWSQQGHVYRQMKQFDRAEKAFKRVQSFANQSTANQALTLANFGLLNISKGNLAEAEDAFNQSLSIYKKIEDDTGIANTSYQLAGLFQRSDRFKKAETYYLNALEIQEKQDNFKALATTHTGLGSLYQAMQMSQKAQKAYETALEISLNNNFDEDTTNLYKNLGSIAEQNGQIEKAQDYYAKASGEEINNRDSNSIADELGKQAIQSRKNRDFIAAEEQHKQAIKIYQENKYLPGTIVQQTNLGFLYRAWGKNDLACLVWRDTLVIAKRSNNNREGRIQALLDSTCQ